jgi:hypothetical protein
MAPLAIFTRQFKRRLPSSLSFTIKAAQISLSRSVRCVSRARAVGFSSLIFLFRERMFLLSECSLAGIPGLSSALWKSSDISWLRKKLSSSASSTFSSSGIRGVQYSMNSATKVRISVSTEFMLSNLSTEA